MTWKLRIAHLVIAMEALSKDATWYKETFLGGMDGDAYFSAALAKANSDMSQRLGT